MALQRKKRRFWIGATNKEWTWHGYEHMLYTNWLAGYPKVQAKSCLLLRENTSKGYIWTNANCTEKKPYICQYHKAYYTPHADASKPAEDPKSPADHPPNLTSEPDIRSVEGRDTIDYFPLIGIFIALLVILVAIYIFIICIVYRKRRSRRADSAEQLYYNNSDDMFGSNGDHVDRISTISSSPSSYVTARDIQVHSSGRQLVEGITVHSDGDGTLLKVALLHQAILAERTEPEISNDEVADARM
ncbi:macrophage mannose receptor 1-like [Lineus longissimus]|uniref:macrophage mannose receptor 1-like n=1 Tax=Lineus longissimus TaxID=88925 RepID=UPI00315DBECE